MDPSPIVITFAAFFLLATVSGQEPFRRFEYKYSFKPPYLSQKDGTVPFWEHSGSEERLALIKQLITPVI